MQIHTQQKAADALDPAQSAGEAAPGGQPLHNPLPAPVRIRRDRMEFSVENAEDEFDVEISQNDEFDV